MPVPQAETFSARSSRGSTIPEQGGFAYASFAPVNLVVCFANGFDWVLRVLKLF